MQAAFSAAMKNMGAGLGNLSLIGTITIILGFFLWIVPSIGMIVYLRSTKLKALMK
jgi:tellurite resistance protein TehA-like permease